MPSIKSKVQEAMKTAMKDKDRTRLDCLRMIKGALLLKEKEKAKGTGLTEEEEIATLRGEIRKREQTLEILREHHKTEEAGITEKEIAVIQEFLPAQLSPEQVEQRVRAYLDEHPEVTHPGKLTGILKKELGDQADGKVLNEACRKVLGA